MPHEELNIQLLRVIRERASVRKYSDTPVPDEALNSVLEAGIWGPSVPSFLRIQPWKFVAVREKKVIRAVGDVLLERSKVSPSGVSLLLKSAAGIVSGAPCLVAVYNSDDVMRMKDKYKEAFANFAEILPKAELCAIAAAVQNMVLTAATRGLGSCWLDMPLFCEKEVNAVLGEDLKLVAVLTLGFPAELGKRAPRKAFGESVKYI
jgi:nitroreductase